MKTFIYETLEADPYYNLAVEDTLCEYVSLKADHGEELCGMFLWQSENAVVIGRNQNPLRECDMEVLRENQVKLVRRLTGGGAVYQDLGNLNYSFISPDGTLTERNLRIVTGMLKKLGLETVCSGRNDITTLQGQKVSGTAQKKYEHAFLLHGTLMVGLNKDMADKCLTPNKFKLANKGISSVKARIVNIGEIIDGCSVHDVKECMKKEFMSVYADSEVVIPDLQEFIVMGKCHRLHSSDWIMGRDFFDSWIVEKEWGTVRFCVSEYMGCIDSIKYETDCMEIDFMDHFLGGLSGVELDRKKLLQYMETVRKEYPSQRQCIIMAEDLIEKIISELQ